MTAAFGEVEWGDGYWRIRCEPHVRARLKRTFARAPQQAADVVAILDTPENSRDLEWFLLRYPMKVHAQERLEARADAHRTLERQVAMVLQHQAQAGTYALAKPPRPYQIEAADLLQVVGGLLCADDVGSGKTVTAILPLAHPENRPALIVVPTHMPRQWEAKLNEFLPGLRIHRLKKGRPYPLKDARRDGQKVRLGAGELPDVVLTNYHKLRGWADSLAELMRYVVFDECQQLRSPATDIYRAATHVAGKAARVLGLSATPIYNYGNEFFYVADALRPGCLGERGEFIREWCTGFEANGKARLADPAQFGAHLRREGIMIRRTLREIGRELPPVTTVVQEIDADEAALHAIDGDAVRLAQVILRSTEQQRGEKMQAAGELDRLVRQATGLAKAPAVAAFVRMLLDSEERVILFGWHHAVYRVWAEQLAEFKPVFYTGEESPIEKDRALAAFRGAYAGGGSRVLIMSLRAGAGVDGLQQFCRVGVFGELDWSPGVHTQCIGRFHRDDQAVPCVAYFMVSNSGADPIMVDVLGVKTDQSEGVRNPDRPLVSRADDGGARRLAESYLRRRGLDGEVLA